MSLNLAQDVRPISYIKTNAADMMRYVNDNHNPVVITQNGEAKAVLLDIGSYQEMKNAFNLIKIISLSEKDIQSGNGREASQVFSNIRKSLKK